MLVADHIAVPPIFLGLPQRSPATEVTCTEANKQFLCKMLASCVSLSTGTLWPGNYNWSEQGEPDSMGKNAQMINSL